MSHRKRIPLGKVFIQAKYEAEEEEKEKELMNLLKEEGLAEERGEKEIRENLLSISEEDSIMRHLQAGGD